MRYQVRQVLGNYRIVRLLGVGGFSEVYLGEHVHLGTQAAIKVLTAELTAHEVDQFRNEARTVLKLEHPNIVRVYDFGLDGNVPYIVMGYAPSSLSQCFPQKEKQLLKDVLPYIKQAAMALQYAHNQKCVHRDVKPGNMLLGANNEVLLCDFGISVMAHGEHSLATQDVIGTLHYMAPEQLEGKPRPASDQYALGVVVYEWLCGVRPFQGSAVEVMRMHLFTRPTPMREHVPDISPTVEYVIMKALEKDPQRRFTNIQAFANALENAYQLEVSHSLPGPNVSLILPHPFSAKETPQPPSLFFATTKKELQAPSPIVDAIEDLPTILLPSDEVAEIKPTAFLPIKCSWCGTEVLSGDSFCLNCGNLLSSPRQGVGTVLDAGDITLAAQNESAPSKHEWGASLLASSFIMPTIAPSSDDTDNLAAVPREGKEATKEQPLVNDEFATIVDTSLYPPIPFTPPNQPPESIPVTPPSQLPQDLELIKAQWLETGDAHYSAKRYTDALAAYEQVLRLEDTHTRAHIGKGNALLRMGRHKDALATYNYALDIGLEDADIWNAKGEVLYKLKLHEQALEAYDRALILIPDNIRVWIIKGNMLRNLRRYEEALEAYGRVLILKPTNALVWSVKGEVLYRLERYEEALDAYVYASLLMPRRTSIWTAKGEVLYKLKRYKEALETYEHAHMLKPNDSSIASKCEILRDWIRQNEVVAAPPTALLPTALENSNQPGGAPDVTYIARIEDDVTRRVSEDEEHYERFDVFLSYSEIDAIWVEELAQQLEDKHNFRVWLDSWMLIPGQSWQQAKARGIDQAKCCVVCIGKETPSDWFKREIERALNRRNKDKNFRVIPILLPEAKDINVDDFLELQNSVDFRVSNKEYAFYRLVCGIKGVAPGRWSSKEATMIESTNTKSTYMLRDIQQLKQEQLIDEAVAKEYIRVVMENFWLNEWKAKDNKNE